VKKNNSGNTGADNQDETAHPKSGPLAARILGGPLRLNGRAADNIFSGWILPSCYEPPCYWWKNYSAIKVSETTWHLLSIFFRCCIFRQICFSLMWPLRQARLTGTL